MTLSRTDKCVSACDGVEDHLLAPGILATLRAHVSAQHDSLGRCASRIHRLEETLRRCLTLNDINWEALDSFEAKALEEVLGWMEQALEEKL